MNTWIANTWRTAKHSLYPRSCIACSTFLPPYFQSDFCLNCLAELYPLDLGHYRPNPALDHFYGRCRIHNAHVHYNFKPGGRIQRMMHKIKYEGQTQLMRKLGQQMGQKIKSMTWSSDIQAVTCVPIHWKRWYLRGYNQSAILGKAIAENLDLRFLAHGLNRKTHTPSQTGLSRFERVKNLKGSIRCSKTLLQFSHVLLVDDVLTTGATLEACTLCIHQKGDIKVSLACLAIGGM